MNTTLLSQWILEQTHASMEQQSLYTAFHDLSILGKEIAALLRGAGIEGLYGEHDGSQNISGDTVQKLDILANDLCKKALESSGHFAAMASEEEADIVLLPHAANSPYVIAFDPIDGSKNLAINGSVGTVMTIYKRVTASGSPATQEDFTQSGRGVVGAAYVLYGPATVFVFCAGDNVYSATLDADSGEWVMHHDTLQIPSTITSFAHNHAYTPTWTEEDRASLAKLQTMYPQATGRFVGALVADMHRVLTQGGVFVRPFDNGQLRTSKLRLVYELRAFAFIIERAGGTATNGDQPLLDIVATDLHQTSPFYAGDSTAVELF